jgi:membrane protein DedA with SNARE-associated domain
MVESFGVPLPGETALIAFGVLAAAGHYSIGVVIGVAAAAAIIGDSLGYWLIGRVGGRNRPRFAESAALTLSSR